MDFDQEKENKEEVGNSEFKSCKSQYYQKVKANVQGKLTGSIHYVQHFKSESEWFSVESWDRMCLPIKDTN